MSSTSSAWHGLVENHKGPKTRKVPIQRMMGIMPDNEDGSVTVYIAFEAETADTLPVPVQPSWFPTRMAASLHEKSHPLACHISRSNIDSIDTFHGRCSVKHNADDWESEYLRTMCCQRLVCDLQGGYYGDYYILTDPVIEVRGWGMLSCLHKRIGWQHGRGRTGYENLSCTGNPRKIFGFLVLFGFVVYFLDLV